LPYKGKCDKPASVRRPGTTGDRQLLTLLETFWIAAGAVVVLLGIVEAFAHVGAHESFLATVILGQDNRTSTSKTFILMWTLLIGWALTSLVIAGEILNTHGCVKLKMAVKACTAKGDQVGLLQIGWHHFLASGLSGSYLVLLGIPAAAGVAAKAITQSKVDAGTLVKAPATGKQSAAARVAQIFSADDDTTDIGDFQYVIFNLVTAVYFVAQFVRPSTQGLPTIPTTLLGLTSVSAALYAGKKAATRTQPKITGVFPSILRPNATITIIGNGLTDDPTQPRPSKGVSKPQVTISGVTVPAENVKADPAVADRLTAKVPAGLVPDGEQTPISGTIQVLSAYGYITPGFSVELVR
jgi:hypothetical protein